MNDNNGLFLEVISFFPEKFFNKEINEHFTQAVMSDVLGNKSWTSGDPNKFEPDYFCDGIGFELTLASDTKNKNNFIQRMKQGRYCSEDMEADVFAYIYERVRDKATRKYSVGAVNLCVLCLLDMDNWIMDEYGSVTHCLFDHTRQEFFNKLKREFIDIRIFRNIYIIFPDIFAKWWVWDVLNDAKGYVEISKEDILTNNCPYVLVKSAYDRLKDV